MSHDKKPLSVAADEFQRESMRLSLEKSREELKEAQVRTEIAEMHRDHLARMFDLREKRQRFIKKH